MTSHEQPHVEVQLALTGAFVASVPLDAGQCIAPVKTAIQPAMQTQAQYLRMCSLDGDRMDDDM